MTELQQLMSDAGLTVEFQHVPTGYNPQSKDWAHIKWAVTIKARGGQFTTEYSQGIGHVPKSWNLNPKMARGAEELNRALLYGSHKGRKLKEPDPVDVLACLFMDAGAIDQTFDDWAGDCGCDTDSRKALATYEACREIGLNLIRVLGAEVFSKMRECDEIVNH